MYETNPPTEAVAASLAGELHARGQEYALGGAIALGFWGIPRGTVDVDVTPLYERQRAGPHSLRWRGCRRLEDDDLATNEDRLVSWQDY